jgi:hypothetical protein
MGLVPPSFPKGAMIAVLAGNPFKEGQYVVRLKMPANYQLPAHHHPTTENVTVISGSLSAGMGDKLDVDKDRSFAPGGFVSIDRHELLRLGFRRDGRASADQLARRRRHDCRTRRCRQIDAIVIAARPGVVREHARTER